VAGLIGVRSAGPSPEPQSRDPRGAFKQAHLLLDQAEDMAWFNGEVVHVEVRKAEG